MPLKLRQNSVAEIQMDLQIQNVVVLVVISLASAAKSQVVSGSVGLTPASLMTDDVNEPYSGFERAEKIGLGLLPSPEDLAFDREKMSFFTGCGDGWIKRVWIDGRDAEEQVENWTFVGGRPLGVAFGPNQEVIVCELTKGLLNATKGKVEVLCSGADGFKFRGMDGVDVSKDGMIYFTDATLGLLIKYNPSNKISTVLLTDLDYPNGVAIAAQEDFLIFCETYSLKCPKYWLTGKKSGQVEPFAESLPAYPDNVRVDDEGTFWIGLLGVNTIILHSTIFYPNFFLYIKVKEPENFLLSFFGERIYNLDLINKTEDEDPIVKYLKLRRPLKRIWGIIKPHRLKIRPIYGSAGILGVKENGEVIAFISDSQRTLISGGVKVGNSLYFVSLSENFINRLDLL